MYTHDKDNTFIASSRSACRWMVWRSIELLHELHVFMAQIQCCLAIPRPDQPCCLPLCAVSLNQRTVWMCLAVLTWASVQHKTCLRLPVYWALLAALPNITDTELWLRTSYTTGVILRRVIATIIAVENKYLLYIVGVCLWSYVTSMLRARAIFSSVACPGLKCVSILSHKRHDFRKKQRY